MTGQIDRGGATMTRLHPADRASVEVKRYGSRVLFVEELPLRAAQRFAERAIRHRKDIYVTVTTPFSSRDYWAE